MAIEIDVFSDFVCPWCLIGTHRLERVLDDLGMVATIRYRPFMLDPHTPAEGKNIPDELRRKYGRDPAPMQKRVEAEAREAGIRLDLSKQSLFLPTVRAHTLMRHTSVEQQHAFAKDLFEAYFLEAENIADPVVLADLAIPHGHTTADVARLCEDERELEATRREAEMPERMGIHGAPFFIINGALAISGAQSEDVFRRALQQSTSTAGADAP